MSELIEEIRINPQYIQLLRSSYEEKLDDESKPVIRKVVSNTNEYLRKMTSQFGNLPGVLPPNCRYIEKTNNGSVVVIEEPPAYRTIKVSYNMSEEIRTLENEGKLEEYGIDKEFYKDPKNRPYPFTLAFPYIIFIMAFDRYNALLSGQVFLRNARLAGLSDYLLKMPMMNISSEQYICYGDRAGGSHETLNSAVENTIMVFWSAIFNQDYTYNYSAYKDVAGVNTYLGWQALSQINPMFIYSIDWINSGHNLNEIVSAMKHRYHLSSISNVQYRELASIFTQPCESGKEELPYTSSRRPEKLYYDIAQGIYLDHRFYVHVGDPIVWGKGSAFIDSFIGFFDSDRIRMIRLDLGDKLVTVKYTDKVRKYILDGAKKLRFAETGTLKNGAIIKENDIIVIKDSHGRDRYKKVFFVRKTRDGITEARLGNSFYILENLEGQVLDVEKPILNDIELQKGEKYLLTGNHSLAVPLIAATEVEYDGIDVDDNGNLTFNFYGTYSGIPRRDQRHRVYTRQTRPSGKTIFKIDGPSMPPIFRIGKKLFNIEINYDTGTTYAWSTKNGVVLESGRLGNQVPTHEIEKHLLFNRGTTLHIPGYDVDITFNVGEKVVCADWKNPMNMLIPKTITAFKLDHDENTLSFVLSDKNGNLSQVPYIRSSSSSAVIHIGRIRKIVNKYNRVSAGTKIMAQKGYIPHFPKKDVNIIIGFITDTGSEPLVLCSNCCTLWFSDMMENFKRVTMKSKKWPELAHAPIDINKIKFQPGDILTGVKDLGGNNGWLVVKDDPSRSLKVHPLNYYTRSTEFYTMDSYMRNNLILDCIPNPRIGSTEQSRMKYVTGFPTLHGLFVENPNSKYYFMDDERSIINVQSSCE